MQATSKSKCFTYKTEEKRKMQENLDDTNIYF